MGSDAGGVKPSGTVTFLFTDIEGSTRRWETDPAAMRVELAAHDEALRGAIESHGGWLFKHTGDGVCAAFESARPAVDAAIRAQRSLGLPVRMGIATGEAELRGDDYFGSTLNTAARVMATGHGGQVLLAASTSSLVAGVDLVDMGLRTLRDLSGQVRIFQVRAEGLRVEFPPLRTLDAVPGNLPVQATSLVGRDDAVTVIADAVAEHRVVTLIGVGGVGKTRLALQSAALLAGRFRDGVWLIELALVADADAVAASVASVFLVQPQAGRSWRDVVVDSLRGREALLVIDNCEHVLDEVAGLVEAIVGSCPTVRVLVTSRESLSVGAEWAWRVPSLPVGEGSVASALFVERADHAASGFAPDSGDAAVIAEICARLDGIPLAIELAAARVRSMSPTQIRDRLDERFRLLTGSRRSIERHQTLRHAVQWSYDLLDAHEQRTLQRVAVFSGGFTLSGAVAVCADDGLDEFEMLDVLDSLVRKSLVNVERSDRDVRYAMLETIRQFAEESLAGAGDGDATRDLHARFFADQCDIAEKWLESPSETLAYRFADTEIANLAAAFRWSGARGLVDPAVRIARTAHRLARNRLRTETFGWPEEVLGPAREAGHRLLPAVLAAACDSALAGGSLEDAERFALEAIILNDDGRYEHAPNAYIALGFVLMSRGDVDGSLATFRTGSEHPADRDTRVNLGFLHAMAGAVGVRLPDDEVENAIAALDASPMPSMRATAFWVRAIKVAENDVAAAIAFYQQAIDLSAASGARTLEETCRGFQLGLLGRTSDVDAALRGLGERVNTWEVMGDLFAATIISELANLLARLGYHDGAARLWGAVAHGASEDEFIVYAPSIPTTRDAMGPVAFTIAYEAGAALDPRRSGQLAHELIAQARADHAST